jgi:hypothetical protein
VCRRLDGLPLAIELAAAWMRVMAPGELAAGLHDRFAVLVGRDRTASPRHRTLRAAVDWSYDLLAEPERVLFGRLSVFAGGWTLEAAEAVGADSAPPDAGGAPAAGGAGATAPPAVLDRLTALVDKSLVQVSGEGPRAPGQGGDRGRAAGAEGDGRAARRRHPRPDRVLGRWRGALPLGGDPDRVGPRPSGPTSATPSPPASSGGPSPWSRSPCTTP